MLRPEFRPDLFIYHHSLFIQILLQKSKSGKWVKQAQQVFKASLGHISVKTVCKVHAVIRVRFNSSFSAKSWQNPATIDIQWLQRIECQCCQNSAMIWQGKKAN